MVSINPAGTLATLLAAQDAAPAASPPAAQDAPQAPVVSTEPVTTTEPPAGTTTPPAPPAADQKPPETTAPVETPAVAVTPPAVPPAPETQPPPVTPSTSPITPELAVVLQAAGIDPADPQALIKLAATVRPSAAPVEQPPASVDDQVATWLQQDQTCAALLTECEALSDQIKALGFETAGRYTGGRLAELETNINRLTTLLSPVDVNGFKADSVLGEFERDQAQRALDAAEREHRGLERQRDRLKTDFYQKQSAWHARVAQARDAIEGRLTEERQQAEAEAEEIAAQQQFATNFRSAWDSAWRGSGLPDAAKDRLWGRLKQEAWFEAKTGKPPDEANLLAYAQGKLAGYKTEQVQVHREQSAAYGVVKAQDAVVSAPPATAPPAGSTQRPAGATTGGPAHMRLLELVRRAG